jgi:hypothetical protein
MVNLVSKKTVPMSGAQLLDLLPTNKHDGGQLKRAPDNLIAKACFIGGKLSVRFSRVRDRLFADFTTTKNARGNSALRLVQGCTRELPRSCLGLRDLD